MVACRCGQIVWPDTIMPPKGDLLGGETLPRTAIYRASYDYRDSVLPAADSPELPERPSTAPAGYNSMTPSVWLTEPTAYTPTN